LSNNENAGVVVGARSSLFLPFKKLGLIVVDEEHEVSYKQFDPSPRYHARDSSIVLASLHNAKVILGSATPSIETSFNSTTGKYGWVKLNVRYGGVALPEIETVDLKEAYHKKQMKGVFSRTLLEEISNALKEDKQIILFQNRRGYAPVHECIDCGHMPQCNQCDVTLTYHQYSEKLKCHYCGYQIPKPTQCHACGMTNLATKGVGTQQIQEQVEQFFPGVKVGRMDWDSTRGKWDFDKLINSFTAQETKILVGTQMVVKGLDFKHVRLVGVLNADHLLNFPDFRSHERTYQMLSQVAGRAGRKGERGKVIIQTYQPKHPIIQKVIENDYEGMLKDQLHERKQYLYPPFYRLIRIVIKHKDLETVKLASNWIFNVLNQSYSDQILGPIFPNIARLRNYYQMQLLIKVENDNSRKVVKQLISRTLKSFDAIGKFKSARVNVDVDPY
jgi:primosomal protein N' (replication factor Y)